MSKILVIEDNEVDYISIRKIIEKEIDGVILPATCKKEAIELLVKEKFDCIILDYMLPDCDGLQLLDEIKQNYDTPVLFITGYGEELIATKAIAFGATNYFSKNMLTDSTLFIQCLKKSIELEDFSTAISEIKAKCRTIGQKIETNAKVAKAIILADAKVAKAIILADAKLLKPLFSNHRLTLKLPENLGDIDHSRLCQLFVFINIQREDSIMMTNRIPHHLGLIALSLSL